jgi:hypothetical protein
MGDSTGRLAILLVCFPCVGCLHVPYCLPEINHVAPIEVQCPAEEVAAFRVDTRSANSMVMGICFGGPRGFETTDHQVLTRIAASTQGTTTHQWGLGVEHGWRVVGIGAWNYTSAFTSHDVAVRLYRRGHATIELKPGQSPRELKWIEAATLAEQEKAVDDLLGNAPSKSEALEFRPKHSLELAATTAAEKDALRFAAGEYEWLANHVSSWDAEPEKMRQRLHGKAQRLRALVGEQVRSKDKSE